MKRFLTILTVSGFMVAGAQTLFAQDTMTLKNCMEYAVSNSTKMKISAADRDDEQVARRDAILQAFTPSISASSNAYYNFGRSVDPETNTYKSTTAFSNGYSAGANFTIFNGFEAVNNLKISKTSKEMGISKEQQIIDEICLATMQAYYNVVYYTQLSEILKDEVETSKKQLRLVSRQEQMGQKGYADVVQIESSVAEKEYKLIDMQNKLADAILTLKDVMFYPVDEELKIDNSIAAEDLDVNAILNEMPITSNTEEIVNTALAVNPSVIIAKGELSNAKLGLSTSKWQLMPSLSFSAGWSTSYFTYPTEKDYITDTWRNQFKNNSGEYLQVSLSIPIYGRLSRQSNISRRKSAYTRAQAQYDQKTREVEAEVKRAVQDRDGAVSAFIQAQKRAEVEEQAYQYNSKKFDQGLISSIEFQTASTNYLNSQAERLNSLLQYYIKRSVVAYYSGISYLEQE